jgi:serine protease Do
MKKDIDFIEQADAYVRGNMNEEERRLFEDHCKENPAEASKYREHVLLLEKLNEYQNRIDFRSKLESIQSRYEIPKTHKSANSNGIVKLWKNYGYNALIAASVALIIVFSTLWMSGFYSDVKDNSSKYSALKRDMNRIVNNVNAQNKVISNISSNVNVAAPSTFGGTGFALTSNGYIATNYHVINGADSIYVQNTKGDSFKTEVVYIDPTYDIAILEIVDSAFKETAPLPYTFKKAESDLGQDVFTIGFPREEAVYGRGYLSSNTGFGGDTIAYQVSIPVNPGNSGGPVLDDSGNVIGVINGKQKEADGAAFAIKTSYLLKSVEEISQDALNRKLQINKNNLLKGLSRTAQIKKIQDFVYIVKVY